MKAVRELACHATLFLDGDEIEEVKFGGICEIAGFLVLFRVENCSIPELAEGR